MVRQNKKLNLPFELGSVLFEMHRVGNVMRVMAIDPRSGTEITMVADPRQSQYVIKTVAAQKLAYVIQKNKKKILEGK